MMLRYHHVGIPTDRPLPREDYSEKYKMCASGYFESPYGVEWMSFDPDCPLPDLVKTVPHVAFVVENLEAAIAGKEVLIPPNSPTEGVRVAFIVDMAPRLNSSSSTGPRRKSGRTRPSSGSCDTDPRTDVRGGKGPTPRVMDTNRMNAILTP